jgi:CRP-like cAMP-binding protein
MMLSPIDYFEHVAATVRFEAGETIFHQGEWAEGMFAVQSGAVQIMQNGVPVAEVGPGGFFGEMALVDHEPRAETSIARTAVELAPTSKHEFMYLAHETPSFALEVMQSLATRLRNNTHCA